MARTPLSNLAPLDRFNAFSHGVLAIIGASWMEHSRLTRFMKQGDNVSYGLNLLVLLTIGLLRFSTKLMVSNLGSSGIGLAVLVYGLNALRPMLPIPASQAWFWTEEWQAGEREADADIKAGRGTVYNSGEEFLASLDRAREIRTIDDEIWIYWRRVGRHDIYKEP